MISLLLACTGATPTPPAPPTSGALRMLTYNVQGLPDPLTESERPGLERMPAIAPLLDDYDIVGLQEDFIEENHALLTDTAHAEKHWFSALVEPDRVYGSGLSLLSNMESIDYTETHYSQCNGVLDGSSDCLASKGFQRMTVVLGTTEVDIINTHHEAGGGPDDDAARRSQVLEVIDAIDANPDRAVIFLGDTNLRYSDAEDVDDLALYTDAGLRDACTEVGCPEPDHIDRFMVRDAPGIALSVDQWINDAPRFDFPEGDPMSDHPAIVIELSWENLPE